MSTRTAYYNLVVPELSDAPDITELNENWTTIEHHLKQKMHVETGNYAGTGTYGTSHKTSITFPDYFLPTTININGFETQFYVRWYEYEDNTYNLGIVSDNPDLHVSYRLTFREGGVPFQNIYNIKNFILDFYSDTAEKQFNAEGVNYDWFSMGR